MLHIADAHGLQQNLPAGTITFEGNMGAQTTIDLCFTTPELTDRIVTCQKMEDIDQGGNHWPIETTMNIEIGREPTKTRYNWDATDHAKLIETLERKLPTDLQPGTDGLEEFTEQVVTAIREAAAQSTPLISISPTFSHRGFNDECGIAVKAVRKAKRTVSLLKSASWSPEYQEAKQQFTRLRAEKKRLVKKNLRQTHRNNMAETASDLART